MSEYGSAGPGPKKERDPLLRFLGGCAAIAAVAIALVLVCGWYVGWRLTRDPAPGRPVETFLTGGETRYWCVDLEPDDAGLQEMFERLDAMGEESRRKALEGTFLESVPLPHRRAHLDEVAPLTLEGSMFGEPGGWAVRATFSHQAWKMRAAMKMMRWMMGRQPGKSETIDVDGVPVTEVHDRQVRFALANAGNRVLAASDASRMREILTAHGETRAPVPQALHGRIRLPGEDGWAFLSNATAGRLANPVSIATAAASFDVHTGDDLVFRVAVSEGAAAPEGQPFRGTVDECTAVVAALLPLFDAEEIEIDGTGAGAPADGARIFSGRVRGLTKRLPELPKRLGEILIRTTGTAPPGPSANPSPPSPPSSEGRRTGTRAVPRREGTPTPPR